MEIKFNLDESGKMIGCNIETTEEDRQLSQEQFKMALSEAMNVRKLDVEKEIKANEAQVQKEIKANEAQVQKEIKESELKYQKFNNIIQAAIESIKYGIHEFSNLYYENCKNNENLSNEMMVQE